MNFGTEKCALVWKFLCLLANLNVVSWLRPSSCHGYPKKLPLVKNPEPIWQSREGQLIGLDECDDQPGC